MLYSSSANEQGETDRTGRFLMDSEPIKHAADAVASVIRARATFKVMGDPAAPVRFSSEVAERNLQTVQDALRIAGWAPFHHALDQDGIAEPWRAHVIGYEASQRLAAKLPEWFTNLKPTNKLVPMMNACGALVLVTWLPQFGDPPTPNPKQRIVNEEHLAATAAMVQNLLLLLTAHGMGTYWSSGGQLGDPKFLAEIGASSGERLSAAVFIEYPETMSESKNRLPGKHRRSRSDRWIREVKSED
ncbi:MAG: nitroreductase family protein [Planctomycetota bacterium]